MTKNNKGQQKFINRTLSRHELIDLANGKKVLIAIYYYKHHQFELWGSIKDITSKIPVGLEAECSRADKRA